MRPASRALFALIVLALPLAGCAKSNAPKSEEKIVVGITDDATGNGTFSPRDITVSPNQLIEWQNHGTAVHQVTVDQIAFARTYDIKPNSIGQLRLGLVGNYTLHDVYHPNMTMSVEVVRQ